MLTPRDSTDKFNILENRLVLIIHCKVLVIYL